MAIQNKEAFQALLEVDKSEHNFKNKQGYYRAYVLSILLPPLGIYYFIRYVFFSDGTTEDFKAGILSVILTILSFLLGVWLVAALFKQTTSSSPQNSEFLKELITPENQKRLKDLLQ